MTYIIEAWTADYKMIRKEYKYKSAAIKYFIKLQENPDLIDVIFFEFDENNNIISESR